MNRAAELKDRQHLAEIELAEARAAWNADTAREPAYHRRSRRSPTSCP